jgi:hypothetical protein
VISGRIAAGPETGVRRNSSFGYGGRGPLARCLYGRYREVSKAGMRCMPTWSMSAAGTLSSVHVPEVLVRMRTGGQSTRSLRNIWRGNRESWEIARRLGIARSPLWMARKLGYRVGQFFRRPEEGKA